MLSAIRKFFTPKTIIIGFDKISFRLETQRLVIRDFKKKDKESLHRISNDFRVCRGIRDHPGNFSLEDISEWIETSRLDCLKNPRKRYNLGIELKGFERLIGYLCLTDINLQDKKCLLGYFLDPEFWKRGYMYEATKGFIGYAFETLNLRRIGADVYSSNGNSEKLLTKLGFVKEGLLRENHELYTGEVVDTTVYGLLRRDWKDN